MPLLLQVGFLVFRRVFILKNQSVLPELFEVFEKHFRSVELLQEVVQSLIIRQNYAESLALSFKDHLDGLYNHECFSSARATLDQRDVTSVGIQR